MAKNEFKVVTTLMLDPEKIEMDPKFLGRRKPVDEETVEVLAKNIKEVGQQLPIQVRQIPGTDRYTRIFGNTRLLAALRLKNGNVIGKGTENEKVIKGDPDFKIRCEVVECTDEEAIQRNMVENEQRTNLNWVDQMFNHATLRNEQGMSDAAITKLLGYAHQATVTRLKKIHEANLPDYVIAAGETQQMTLSAAFYIADECKDILAEGKFGEVWAKLGKDTDDEGRIGKGHVQAAVREWRKEKAEAANPTPAGEGSGEGTGEGSGEAATTEPTPEKQKQLTVKAFKDLLTASAGSEVCPPKTKDVLSHILLVIDGATPINDLNKLLMRYLGEKPLPVKEKLKAEETPAEPKGKGKGKGKKEKEAAATA